jgi:hypothetical protein
MAAILAYLQQVATPEAKLSRIAERVQTLVRHIVEADLGRYRLREGEEAVKDKEVKAKRVADALAARASMLGELLALMQPSLEHVRGLYLSSEDADKDKSATPGFGDGFISLDLDGGDFGGGAPESGGARAFARALVSDWQARLRALPRSAEVLRFLQLPEEALETLVEEVVVGSNRLKVETRLAERLREVEDRSGATRARLADQQALVARGVVADYVDSLGLAELPEAQRPMSTRIAGRKLFTAPPAINGLPNLGERPLNYPAIRICDWLDAFVLAAVNNVGCDSGREISLEHSRRLEAILQGIEAGGQGES